MSSILTTTWTTTLLLLICRVANAYVTLEISDAIAKWRAGYFDVIVDVRTQSEWDSGHVPGAVFVPLYDDDWSILGDCKDKKIAVYCRSGSRSKVASGKLDALGFTEVYDVLGVMQWTQGGVAMVNDPSATPNCGASEEEPTNDDDKVCCEAMTKECVACKKGKTEDEVCAEMPNLGGCKKDDGDDDKVCCEAMTVECMACKSGKSKDEICGKMPDLGGCEKDDGGDDDDSVCCEAMTKECQACKMKKPEHEVCAEMPDLAGCMEVMYIAKCGVEIAVCKGENKQDMEMLGCVRDKAEEMNADCVAASIKMYKNQKSCIAVPACRVEAMKCQQNLEDPTNLPFSLAKCIIGGVDEIADEDCQKCVQRMSRATCPMGPGAACDMAIKASVANTACRQNDAAGADVCNGTKGCMYNAKWEACVVKPKPHNCMTKEAWTAEKKVWCCANEGMCDVCAKKNDPCKAAAQAASSIEDGVCFSSSCEYKTVTNKKGKTSKSKKGQCKFTLDECPKDACAGKSSKVCKKTNGCLYDKKAKECLVKAECSSANGKSSVCKALGCKYNKKKKTCADKASKSRRRRG